MRGAARTAAGRRALLRALVGPAIVATLIGTAGPVAAGEPEPPPKREVPDYDGRGEDPTTARDVLLWVPRVLVSPLYAVTEYGLRRPIVYLLTEGERRQWPQKVVEFLRFGPGQNAIIYPTFVLDFGFRPNGGLVFKWKDIGARKHSLALRFATGGRDWFLAGASHAMPLRGGGTLGLDFGFVTRPDNTFYGLGPSVPGDPEPRYGLSIDGARSRYASTRVEGGLSLARALGVRSQVSASSQIRWVNFLDARKQCCGDPSIATRVAEGTYPLPPGYADDYLVFQQTFALDLDTRPPRPQPGGGITVSPRATLGVDLRNTGDDSYSWLEYGGAVAASVDLAGHYRILTLQATTLFIDPLGGQVPFTELLDAAVDGPLSGFTPGHLIGRSLAAVSLEYRWPVWLFLDGTVNVAVGNVFGEHFDHFDARNLRMSFGLGMRAASSGDIPFTLMLALGTDRLGDQFGIDSVRFVVGTTSGL